MELADKRLFTLSFVSVIIVGMLFVVGFLWWILSPDFTNKVPTPSKIDVTAANTLKNIAAASSSHIVAQAPDTNKTLIGGQQKTVPQQLSAGLLDYLSSSYQPVTIDDLLDPADRTERSQSMLSSYDGLLINLHGIQAVRQQVVSIESISVLQIKEWTQALINYLAISNADFQKLSIPPSSSGQFNPALLPADSELSDLINKGYFEAVKALVDKVNGLDDPLPDNGIKQSLVNRISELTLNAKKQSSVFLLTKMKHYFKSGGYSLTQKISFARSVVNTQDGKMIRSVRQYFEYALTLPEYENEQQKIKDFIEILPRD